MADLKTQLVSINGHLQLIAKSLKQLLEIQYSEVQLITLDEAGRRLDLSPRTLLRYIALGKTQEKGWKKGYHYIELQPAGEKPVYRVVWTNILREHLDTTIKLQADEM
jgi:hypothetical protein